MRKLSLLALSFFVVGFLAIWHITLGLGGQLYEIFWWWDIPSHMLGGLGAALFTAWAASAIRWRITLLLCVTSAFIIGVGWEIFEYSNHLGGSPFMSYTIDTIKDLIDDAIGGAAAFFVSRRIR